jgi:hypothetical protein
VVNLACRLCSSVVDGQVIIDDVTAAALGETLPPSHWATGRSGAREANRHLGGLCAFLGDPCKVRFLAFEASKGAIC